MNDNTDFDAFLAEMQRTMSADLSVAQMASDHPGIAEDIAKFHPIKTALSFAALALSPQYQSNCLTIEVLTHMAIALGKGQRRPSARKVSSWFARIREGRLGFMEDPAEDTFTVNVITPFGNNRMLSGVWEGAVFYTERMLNAVEKLSGDQSNDWLRPAYDLLRLSEMACERAGLPRNILGGDVPLNQIAQSGMTAIARNSSHLRFSEAELETLGIEIESLAPFGFDPSSRDSLLHETLGNTSLERSPLVYHDGNAIIILPTAISAAVRRFIVDSFTQAGKEKFLLPAIALEYGDFFQDQQLLGGKLHAPIQFQKMENGVGISGVVQKIDKGRYINYIFYTDNLNNFSEEGFGGHDPDFAKTTPYLDEFAKHGFEYIASQKDFGEAITLFVSCGVGRVTAIGLNVEFGENWRWEHISAADLYTLNCVTGFSPIEFWKLVESRTLYEKTGILLQNPNGLLNLVAWARSLKGHLVPHSEIPDDFHGENLFISIDPTSLRKLRCETLISRDEHSVTGLDGNPVTVIRSTASVFEEDKSLPIYAIPNFDPKYGIRLLYESPTRLWWAEMRISGQTTRNESYRRWQTIQTWLQLSVPVLEAKLPSLPSSYIHWQTEFRGDVQPYSDLRAPISLEQAIGEIECNADAEAQTVTLSASPRFEDAFFNVENIAERALVSSYVRGVIKLCQEKIDDALFEEIIGKIVSSPFARQTHALIAKDFRDVVSSAIPLKPVYVEPLDDGYVKLSHGWLARDRSLGGDINSSKECTEYLNETVRHITASICSELRKYDRADLIHMCLMNHEAAAKERNRWRRTSPAVKALHTDAEATQQTIIRTEQELNAVFQTSRILAEMAISESPLEGGVSPGKVDLSRLMAKVLQVMHLGNSSDAIHWGFMRPELKITALGDVLLHFDFFDKVVRPYSERNTEIFVEDAGAKYEENFKQPEYAKALSRSEEYEELFQALESEFGVRFDDVRIFVEYLEDVGYQRQQAVFKMRRSDFSRVQTDLGQVDQTTSGLFLDHFSMKPRQSWEELPPGYTKRDLHIWKFRRAHSLLQRPIVQLSVGDDPTYIVAPGFVREAFAFQVGCYQNGDYPASQLSSEEMKRWKSKVDGSRGEKFELKVLDKMASFGWSTEHSVNITKIFGRSFDRNYGEIDVLAWKPQTSEVLIIECKDVQYRKTPGEIAEQMSDFLGDYNDKGKPDLLRKHLDRVELLSENLDTIYKYCKMSGPVKIHSLLVFRNPVPMQFAWDKYKEICDIVDYNSLDLWNRASS